LCPHQEKAPTEVTQKPAAAEPQRLPAALKRTLKDLFKVRLRGAGTQRRSRKFPSTTVNFLTINLISFFFQNRACKQYSIE
jgi:hypothetical protein